jgi:hypothetical protein
LVSELRGPAALLVAVVGSGIAACGADRPPPDSQLVREAVDRFARASARKDYQQICDELVSQRLVESVEQVGLPCEVALRNGLRDVRKPRLTIRSIEVTKGRARVAVRSSAVNQKPSNDTLQLVKEDGDWKIAALAQAEPRARATGR